MKTTIYKSVLFVVVVTLSMILSSCTKNDGDVGGMYGTWKVEAIDKDGSIDQSYYIGNIFFEFQSNVFCMREVYDYNGVDEKYAYYTVEGNTMIIDFRDERYIPYPVTGMMTGNNVIDIVRHSSDEVVLKYINPSSNITYTYFLKKWG